MTNKKRLLRGLGMALGLILSACNKPTHYYSVGGHVNGMLGSGLVLQLNGASDITVANGYFTFQNPLKNDTAYTITVKTQPTNPSQTCHVINATGTLSGADVNTAVVQCAWTQQLGAAEATVSVGGEAMDSEGNLYVVGSTDKGLDGHTLIGARDYFITKYDSAGNRIFTQEMGVRGATVFATGVATNGATLYVTGYTDTTLGSNYPQSGTQDFFLAQFDTGGTQVNVVQCGVPGASTFATGVATDMSGNAYVTGYTDGGLYNGASTPTGAQDFFLAQFTKDALTLGPRIQLGVAGSSTIAKGVALDTNDDVYVVGYTNGGLYNGNTNATGSQDLFLARFDSALNKKTAIQTGIANEFTKATGVATATTSTDGVMVYVTGVTTGSLAGTNTKMGAWDFFLGRYHASYDGTLQQTYLTQLGASGATIADQVAVTADSGGNAYVAGGITGAGLDGNTLTGTQDFFVTKYGDTSSTNSPSTGSSYKLYTRELGVAGTLTDAVGVTTDTAGSYAYVTGVTSGGLDANVLAGALDLFVAKYDASGQKQ